MTRQFGRVAELEVGGLLVRRNETGGLWIGFRVEKTTEPEPNTCEVEILGLNAEHRRQLAEQERVPVRLEAGYEDNSGQIFLGDLRRARSEFSGAWVTTIESGDGEKETKGKRVAQSFSGKTQLATVIRALANALGVGTGNLEAVALKARWLDGGADFRTGTVIAGNPADELTRLLQSAGLEWSILDGELQLLERGKPVGTEAVLLTGRTGLIGAPCMETRDGDKQVAIAKALINPAIQPGVIIDVRHSALSAVFRAERCIYTGQVGAPAWYVDVEGRLL